MGSGERCLIKGLSKKVRAQRANTATPTSGVGGTAGIGLAEVYDLSSGAAAKLANISTRGVVQTGDSVLIGGFIIRNPSGRVIVRAMPAGGYTAIVRNGKGESGVALGRSL